MLAILVGIATGGLGMLLHLPRLAALGGGAMIVAGAHQVTFALNGLRSYERPMHEPDWPRKAS